MACYDAMRSLSIEHHHDDDGDDYDKEDEK